MRKAYRVKTEEDFLWVFSRRILCQSQIRRLPFGKAWTKRIFA